MILMILIWIIYLWYTYIYNYIYIYYTYDVFSLRLLWHCASPLADAGRQSLRFSSAVTWQHPRHLIKQLARLVSGQVEQLEPQNGSDISIVGSGSCWLALRLCLDVVDSIIPMIPEHFFQGKVETFLFLHDFCLVESSIRINIVHAAATLWQKRWEYALVDIHSSHLSRRLGKSRAVLAM